MTIESQRRRRIESIEKELGPAIVRTGRLIAPWSDGGPSLAAIHEAGHAVIGHLVGYEIHSLTIVPDENNVGQCQGSDSRRPAPFGPTSADLYRKLAFFLGGPAAESLRSGKWLGVVQDSDCTEAENIAAQLCAGLSPNWLAESQFQRVRKKLAQPREWKAVWMLASHLQWDGDLTGSRIRSILATAMPGVTFGSWSPEPG